MDDAPPDLSHAGAVVDQAIDYMVNHQIGSLAIASALLGGAMGLMARTMPADEIVRVLTSAMASVQDGALLAMDGGRPPS